MILKKVRILFILLIAGAFSVSIYFALIEIQKKDETKKSETFLAEEITKQEPKEISPPLVYFSSDSLEQGDTLLIKVNNESVADKVSGEFGLVKIDFFKPLMEEGWIGILGISAKGNPGKYNLVINFSNGKKLKKEINIIKRKFPITELVVTKELEEKGFTPSKIKENVIGKENLIIGEILGVYTPEAYFDKAFTNPLREMKNAGSFGNIRKSGNVSLQHLGVDLEADIGTPIYAINNGVVHFSQELTTYGKTLIIDHGLGIFSLYLHLDEFKVLSGQAVQRGDIIGFSGNTGYSIAPHLHFSVKVNGASVDPLRFIETIRKELKEQAAEKTTIPESYKFFVLYS